MSSNPVADVSIIVPNYNNGKYLSEFIGSVVDAAVWPAELLIVDDGSTDHSREILGSFEHLDFLRVIYLDENKGLTTALNTALDHARSRYIMRSDPDDRIHPLRLSRQYEFMEKHPGIDVLGCNVIYFDDLSGKPVNRSNFPLMHSGIEKAYRRGEHGIQHPTAFVRSKVYKSYRYQPVFPGEDYEIFARMIRDGRSFANLHQPLYYMRIHSSSSTSNLRFSAIQKTFDFRDGIFNTRTSAKKKYTYFFYIKFYRKFQMSRHTLNRYFYLLLSFMFYPKKLFKRF